MMTPCESPYLECDINQGSRTVIEAAAGTGKTYNITNIVARIIMVRGDITIDKMVVVTFTRAAAGELKSRISKRLAELDTLLSTDSGKWMEDELLKKLLGELSPEGSREQKKLFRSRLRLALLNFDRAMIGTIHSFAMRSLSENGFDSGRKFGFSLQEGTDRIITQLCNDFLRGLSYREDAHRYDMLLSLAAPQYKTFVTSYVLKCLSDPDLQISWPEGIKSLHSFEEFERFKKESEEKIDSCTADRAKQKEETARQLEQREEDLKELEKEKKKVVSQAKKVLKKQDSPENQQALADAEAELAALDAVKEKLKKDKGAFKKFDDETSKKIQALMALPYQGLLMNICQKCLDAVSKEYRRIREEKNFLGNDDLILEMKKALTQPGSSLALRLRAKYPVGLIDEFQDTNNSQFAIFREIFLANTDSTFIVVGDPRQAIYRFRNGDINCYLDAKKEMLSSRNARLFNMNVNFRSGEKYIEGLNALFTSEKAFAMDGMTMVTQKAHPQNPGVLLDPAGNALACPIQCAAGLQLNTENTIKHCAGDIYTLLTEKYFIPPIPATKNSPGQPARHVRPEDITVLTSSWHNANRIKEALQSYGIPVRLMKNPNVFKTPEAEQLQLFLEGILTPGSRDALLRALITPLGDLEVGELKNENLLEARALLFQELNDLWHKRSFMVMFNELLLRFKVNDRLLGAGGERALSNFNTIADILYEESFTQQMPPSALLRSLGKHIRAAQDGTGENFSGKPETDQGTVLVDTVFGSKGLSYPVVFLPDLFALGHSLHREMVAKMYHDDKGKLCYSPFMNDWEFSAEKSELLQENLRKAYVAFTRAKYFCRFYYGNAAPRCSSLDWLFYDHGLPNTARDLTEKLSNAVKKGTMTLPAEILKEELSGDPPEGTWKNLQQLQLRRSDLLPDLISQSGFLSFTSITPHGASSSAFLGDKNDEGEPENEEEKKSEESDEKKKQPENQALPSGTNFGNAIHKILEICDYSLDQEALFPVVERQLKAHGISGESAAEVTTAMLHRMLNTSIPDDGGGSFKLSELPPGERKCEFEFLYEFKDAFTTRKLFSDARKYFNARFNLDIPAPAEKGAAYETGFFNGSIDLFFRHNGKFYIIDWKTNKLKNTGCYKNARLCSAMAASRYYLQYMIYTVALFKYLKQRLTGWQDEKELYEKYMGGVYYIFLRGFDGNSGQGIFRDRLPFEDLQKIQGSIG